MLEFRTEKVDERITRIFCFTTELAYLVEGDRTAALIDSGSGIGSIRACVEKLTDKPLIVLLTHGHVDHAMGASEWPASQIYMNHEDDYVYRDHSTYAKRWAGLELSDIKEAVTEADFIAPLDCTEFHDLRSGDVFDLGGISIEMYSCPGHTLGSLCMLLRETRTVLLGDACNYFTFLFDWYSTSVPFYEESLKKLQSSLQGKYDHVLLSHGDGIGHKGLLQDVIDVCEDIQHNRSDDVPFTFQGASGFIAKAQDPQTGLRIDGGKGNIVYKKLTAPVQTEPAQFPRDEQVPDGCTVLTGLQDTYGYQVDVRKAEFDGRPVILYIPMRKGEEMRKDLPPVSYPAIVYCQGSAFHKQWLFDHISQQVRMAERGFVVAVPAYRPSEEAPFPAQAQDLKNAVRFLKKNSESFRIDPERMALWGDSSGAHTVLMAGITGDGEPDADLFGSAVSASVRCMVDWYGPTDFGTMNTMPSSQNHTDPDCPEGFEIGRNSVLDRPDLSHAASPLTWLSEDRKVPPLLLMHGGRDMLVPFDQSCRLYMRMKELGMDVTFYKLEDANHGFLGFNNDRILDIVESFLRKHL